MIWACRTYGLIHGLNMTSWVCMVGNDSDMGFSM